MRGKSVTLDGSTVFMIDDFSWLDCAQHTRVVVVGFGASNGQWCVMRPARTVSGARNAVALGCF